MQWIYDDYIVMGYEFEYTYYDKYDLSLYTYYGKCEEEFMDWPDLVYEWSYLTPDGDAAVMNFTITPKVYFVTNDEEDKCILSLVSNNNDTSCWLGQPFFREFQVVFDYSEDSVSLFTKYVNLPVNPDDSPYGTGTLTYVLNMTEYGVYEYVMGVGEPRQVGEGIGFSTMATKNVVPSSGCLSCGTNWYDQGTSDTYVMEDGEYYESAGLWGGYCQSS